MEYINSFKQKYNFDFDTFLFPNNNDNGTLEHLLEKIINPEHRGLMDCFTQYENCINHNNTNQFYQLPIQKSKIYAYLEAFKKSNREKEKFKKGDYFFENDNYWDLEADYIIPLVQFLKTGL